MGLTKVEEMSGGSRPFSSSAPTHLSRQGQIVRERHTKDNREIRIRAFFGAIRSWIRRHYLPIVDEQRQSVATRGVHYNGWYSWLYQFDFFTTDFTNLTNRLNLTFASFGAFGVGLAEIMIKLWGK